MEEKEETQETTKDFNLSFLCGACARTRATTLVRYSRRERERERREHASSATCSENGGRANGRPPYCHTLGPPPAIIIIKFRAHNHSNGHQRPGGSGGRRARVTRSPTAQRAHRRHTRVHGLTTPARTRRRMKRRKERRE